MEGAFKELWELARTAGPFGTLLMFYLWWRTDTKLGSLQERYDALLERTLNGLNGNTNALSDLKNVFLNISERGK